MKLFNVLLLGIIILGVSCTGQKKISSNYLYNITDTSAPITILPPELMIQKNDILSIRVYSMSTNPATDVPYNLPDQIGSGAPSAAGFLVDINGNIEYPRLGTLHVEGLTKEQLSELIKKKLESQLTQPSVIVRFMNYKFTVLGEVRSPGNFTAMTDKVTILEALGQAGDVTEYGLRNTIKILREINGKREIGIIDLTSKEMFNSSFYHIQQNDVILVEQSSRKIRQREQQNITQQIGFVSSVIAMIVLILNFTK